MTAAFLTTILFSFSVIFATRSARAVGGDVANLSRMALALVLLAIWAHGWGAGLRGASLPWFLVSGAVGFGLGDIALFLALTRIGPRMTILIVQCLAAPLAALVEWLWLGTRLTTAEVACALVILAGVAVAVAPRRAEGGVRQCRGGSVTGGALRSRRRAAWDWVAARLPGWSAPQGGTSCGQSRLYTGIVFAFLASIGQALGAVITRKANEVATAAQLPVDGGSAAYQRMLGGIVVTALFYSLIWWLKKSRGSQKPRRDWRTGWWLILVNSLAGPTLGVACYQWALASTPSGIVLPVVATSPVATMVLAFFIDGDRPSRRAIVGGIIAVAGAVALTLV
jgi:drug/metabolite transporter (DMT)-like permease